MKNNNRNSNMCFYLFLYVFIELYMFVHVFVWCLYVFCMIVIYSICFYLFLYVFAMVFLGFPRIYLFWIKAILVAHILCPVPQRDVIETPPSMAQACGQPGSIH